MEETKVCNQCGKEKPIVDFYQQEKINKYGKSFIYCNPKCKECCIKNSWERIKNNWEDYKKNHLKDYHNNRWAYAQKENSINRRKNGKYSEWQKSSIGKEKTKIYITRRFHKIHDISYQEWSKCKEYFNNCCAYCGLPIEEHYRKYGDRIVKSDFHKEHVDNNGSNKIDNCIPSCLNCNSSKGVSNFSDWYNEENNKFSNDRELKILKWISEDYNK
jgi:hypothetical protein